MLSNLLNCTVPDGLLCCAVLCCAEALQTLLFANHQKLFWQLCFASLQDLARNTRLVPASDALKRCLRQPQACLCLKVITPTQPGQTPRSTLISIFSVLFQRLQRPSGILHRLRRQNGAGSSVQDSDSKTGAADRAGKFSSALEFWQTKSKYPSLADGFWPQPPPGRGCHPPAWLRHPPAPQRHPHAPQCYPHAPRSAAALHSGPHYLAQSSYILCCSSSACKLKASSLSEYPLMCYCHQSLLGDGAQYCSNLCLPQCPHSLLVVSKHSGKEDK